MILASGAARPRLAIGLLVAMLAGRAPLRAQSLSGDLEWMVRANDASPGGLGSETVDRLQTALSARALFTAGSDSRRWSARLDAYAIAGGEDVSGLGDWRGHLNEAYLAFSSATCGASLGVRRYPDQYSYYWNPTFLPQAKTDLTRPDYLAEGISTGAVWCRSGRLTPKLVVAWNSDDVFPGVQLDGYFGGTEAYANAFTSTESERTFGAGMRRGLGSWTVQAEGCMIWNDQSTYPVPPPDVAAGAAPVEKRSDGVRGLVVVGVNRQALRNGLLVMEVLYDSRGLSAAEFERVRALAGGVGVPAEGDPDSGPGVTVALRPPGELRHSYLHLSYTHAGAKKWKLGLVSLTSLEDGSGYLRPVVEWSAAGRFKVAVTGFWRYGSTGDEFGLLAVRRSLAVSLRCFL
jgi:hypothetical protein